MFAFPAIKVEQGPVAAFRFVSGREFTHAAIRTPIFQETEYAAKPRSNPALSAFRPERSVPQRSRTIRICPRNTIDAAGKNAVKRRKKALVAVIAEWMGVCEE